MDNMPPAMSGVTMPVMPLPAAPPKTRFAAAGCAGVAALLVLVGLLLPLYTVTGPDDGQETTLSITPWGFDPDLEGSGEVPVTGYLLVFATVLLFAAAALCLLAATPGLRQVAATVTVAGAAFMTSAAWAIGMEVVSHAGSIDLPADATPEEAAAFSEGTAAGLWLLLSGALVAVVAMVLALRSTRGGRA